MVMPHTFCIKPGGAAFDGHFAHQTRLHKVPQIVVSRCSGTARIDTIHGFENLRGRGMAILFRQKRHHRVALRRAAQTVVLKGLPDCLDFHWKNLDYV